MDENKRESTPLQRYQELRNKSLQRRKRARYILFAYTILAVVTLMVYYNFFGSGPVMLSSGSSSEHATLRLTMKRGGLNYAMTVTVKSLFSAQKDLAVKGAVGDIAFISEKAVITRVPFGTDGKSGVLSPGAYRAYTVDVPVNAVEEYFAARGKHPVKGGGLIARFSPRKNKTSPFTVRASLRAVPGLETEITASMETRDE